MSYKNSAPKVHSPCLFETEDAEAGEVVLGVNAGCIGK